MTIYSLDTTVSAPVGGVPLQDLGIRDNVPKPSTNFNLTSLGITQSEIQASAQLTEALDNNWIILYADGESIADPSYTPVSDLIEFVGDSGAGGVKGAVPAPSAGDAAANKYLKANGSWEIVPSSGETNTASNVGSGGIGVFLQKTGVNLEFKNINTGSSKVTVTADIPNNEIDIDVVESNFLLQNLGGVLTASKGGTGSSTALNNNRVIQSSAGALVEAPAITPSRAIVSDSNGIPTHSAVTSTEVAHLSGVTSPIQTQLNDKADLVAGKVPAAQLPSYVDDVEEYADLASFPVSGETGKIYIAIDTGRTYRWTGSVYVEISTSNAGTVTTVSVANANGLSGSVSNPSTTPAITLSTTVTGIVKGDGTALSAAVAGTDYVIPSGLSTYVQGPASATDNSIARFDLTTGKLIQNSGVTIDDTGNISGIVKANADTIGLTATGTAPSSPTDGQLYYDSSLKCLMAYDNSRSKWLSTHSIEIWVDRNGNIAAGNSLRTGSGIPTSTTPILLEQNMCLTGVVASTSATENFTLKVDDVSGGSGTSSTISYASGTSYQDLTLNQNYNANDKIDVYVSASTTGNVSDPRVKLIFKYRK
jgi:hypothetical protein